MEIDDGKVISQEKIANPGHQPGFLPQFLRDKGVKCVIAGGMGEHAMAIFARYDIQTILGVSRKIDELLQKFLAGELKSGKSLSNPKLQNVAKRRKKNVSIITETIDFANQYSLSRTFYNDEPNTSEIYLLQLLLLVSSIKRRFWI